MHHLKKVIALLKEELKKVEKEVINEEGEIPNDTDAGTLDGLALAIGIAEDYDNQVENIILKTELSTVN